MPPIFSVLITIISVILFCALYWLWVNPGLRQKKTKQAFTNPTMFDVRRLLKEGDRDAAVRCYSQIFKVSAKKARKDIDELERSLKV